MDRSTEPDVIDSTVVVHPGEILVVRVDPGRIKSAQEFEYFREKLRAAFLDQGAPPPIIVVADQFAIQKSEANT